MKIPTAKVYERAERAKKSFCNERNLQVERGTFTPLIFSVTGGMDLEALCFMKLQKTFA